MVQLNIDDVIRRLAEQQGNGWANQIVPRQQPLVDQNRYGTQPVAPSQYDASGFNQAINQISGATPYNPYGNAAATQAMSEQLIDFNTPEEVIPPVVGGGGGGYDPIQAIMDLYASNRQSVEDLASQKQTAISNSGSRREGQIQEISAALAQVLSGLEGERTAIQEEVVSGVRGRADALTKGVSERQSGTRQALGNQITSEYEEVAEMVSGLTGSQTTSAKDTMDRLVQVANTAAAGREALPASMMADSMTVLTDEIFGLTTQVDFAKSEQLAALGAEERERVLAKREEIDRQRKAAASAAASAAAANAKYEREWSLKVAKFEQDQMEFAAKTGQDIYEFDANMEFKNTELALDTAMKQGDAAAQSAALNGNIDFLTSLQDTYDRDDVAAMTDDQRRAIWLAHQKSIDAFTAANQYEPGSLDDLTEHWGYDVAVAQDSIVWKQREEQLEHLKNTNFQGSNDEAIAALEQEKENYSASHTDLYGNPDSHLTDVTSAYVTANTVAPGSFDLEFSPDPAKRGEEGSYAYNQTYNYFSPFRQQGQGFDFVQ